VVARARLTRGLELDRPHLRAVRRELRRHEALDTSLRALQARDLSRARLEERLTRAGIAADARAEAVGVLARGGLLDDHRVAERRAESLAARGASDAQIRAALARERIEPDLTEHVLAALEPEAERARRLVAARGTGLGTARYLAARGFCEESIEAALPGLIADEW
jgi:SOS response regulatory protein OraA/RecX